jgi:hypothetical protein
MYVQCANWKYLGHVFRLDIFRHAGMHISTGFQLPRYGMAGGKPRDVVLDRLWTSPKRREMKDLHGLRTASGDRYIRVLRIAQRINAKSCVFPFPDCPYCTFLPCSILVP